MNSAIKGLGETVLRVRDLKAMKVFYGEVLGLELIKEFEQVAFFKIADGIGGHTQVIGLFKGYQEHLLMIILHLLRLHVQAYITSHLKFQQKTICLKNYVLNKLDVKCLPQNINGANGALFT